jgi:serine/threonine protein kinase
MRDLRLWLGDDRLAGEGEPDPMIGELVGPFALVRRLGRAGSSRVYLAEHTVLEIRRVVKLLSPQQVESSLVLRRFAHEARALARLQHRNVIEVHDVGQLACGAWFLVSEYLEGRTLARFMAVQGGPLPPRAVLHMACEIANGLKAAHDSGLVHGGLSPRTVFLTARDADPQHVVLLDLGLLSLVDLVSLVGPGRHRRARVRDDGDLAGEPLAYSSPERLTGAPAGPGDDLFALGVLAYQMTTGGWFPYQYGESRAGYSTLAPAELLARQRSGSPVDPRERCADLDDAWASAIVAAVSADPGKRPRSARALALRLAEAVVPVGDEPDGLAIVRSYARELIDAGERDAAGPRGSGTLVSVAAPRYEIGARLGAGGMAEVFAGAMIGAEGFVRRVAIKRMLSGLSQVPAFAAMFTAEAQIASRLAHPNIVSVLDFHRDPEQRLFLVMEYVDGVDLASLLDAGPIAPSLAIFIIVELLRGLGHAHELCDPDSGSRGLVHRDVSPQNLLLGYEGAVKLTDFGLAKLRRGGDGVRSETVRGKPSYMSPEQISGEMLDGRTDLYAVGVMLWEMLAHRPLFIGTLKEILAQAMFRNIVLPSSLRAEAPAELEAVAMKLLARDRDQRYPDASAAIEALLRCSDAPRDGRGELVAALAERFPRGNARSVGTREAWLGAPGAPGASGVASVPGASSVASAPGAASVASVPGVPGVPSLPGVAGSAGASDLLGTTGHPAVARPLRGRAVVRWSLILAAVAVAAGIAIHGIRQVCAGRGREPPRTTSEATMKQDKTGARSLAPAGAS